MSPLANLLQWVEMRGEIVSLESKIELHRLKMNHQVSAATIIGSLVRTALAGWGGGLIADGTITSNQVDQLGGAAAIAITLGWSLYQKWRAKKAAAL